MIFDLDLIKKIYSAFPKKIETARQIVGDRPLTLSEKILFTHFVKDVSKLPVRGIDYVDFAPDRVAMQDATAQMALLQFMTCGRDTVAVPSTVHCDHLIQAKVGAKKDLEIAIETNREVHKDETVFAVSERDFQNVQTYKSVDDFNRARNQHSYEPMEQQKANQILQQHR